jgi:hypothetical protein
MPHHLRFFDDYGCGWLWGGDHATLDTFGYGPLDLVIQAATGLLTPETLAEADALSGLNHSTLNMDDPAHPLPLSPEFCNDFNARVAMLRDRMAAELGPDFVVEDRFRPLIPG